MPPAFRQWHLYRFDFLVPLTGLEPVRMLLRGILSPLCLPIPPQRRIKLLGYYNTFFSICQEKIAFFIRKN